MPSYYQYFCCYVLKNKNTLQQIQELISNKELVRGCLTIGAIWIAFALFMLVDIQVGKNLYLSLADYDYNHRIAITDAICRTGVPPENPFFHPGHSVPLIYYYYWMIVCAKLVS